VVEVTVSAQRSVAKRKMKGTIRKRTEMDRWTKGWRGQSMRILIGQPKVKEKVTRTIQYPVEQTEEVRENLES